MLEGGVWSELKVPGAVWTAPSGVNSEGQVAMTYARADGVIRMAVCNAFAEPAEDPNRRNTGCAPDSRSALGRIQLATAPKIREPVTANLAAQDGKQETNFLCFLRFERTPDPSTETSDFNQQHPYELLEKIAGKPLSW